MVVSWHQGGIFFARMGMTDTAADYNTRKIQVEVLSHLPLLPIARSCALCSTITWAFFMCRGE